MKKIISLKERASYNLRPEMVTCETLNEAFSEFINNQPVFSANVIKMWVEFEISYGYYDEVELEAYVHAKRYETDDEYENRLAKEAAKRLRDAESSKANKIKAKLEKEKKEREEFARLTKLFTGVEISDVNSLKQIKAEK